MSSRGLEELLATGITIVQQEGDVKWLYIQKELLVHAGSEKVVLFAQPIETVSALARYLELTTGKKPAIIIGGQTDAERTKEVEAFCRSNGPQYLVSSRAGGEGINLQVARRLIHVDVPWNPMDMEQRVGRVHRFGSRQTIIVDTLVVKDSREADAYRIAREKLKLIAATLVEPERFESVFSRVMCLLSPDELQGVIINESNAPFDAADEQRLSNMVQKGFHTWKEFHDRFGEQGKSIRKEDSGLCTWDDVVFFLEELGAAKRVTGHMRQRFERRGNAVTDASEDAIVLALADGHSYVCGEYGEELVYDPNNLITPKLGFNLRPVAELLRKYAFPEQPSGAAYLRWPSGTELPSCVGRLPFGISIFLRQTLRMDRMGGWLEQGQAIHCYLTGADSTSEVTGDDKSRLLRGLFRASIRKTSEPAADLVQSLVAMEREVTETLRRPSDEELTNQIRHAVTPLFAAIITS